MREADAGAEPRWTKAASRAEGLTDLGIGGAVRRFFLVYFPLTVLAALVVGFALASLWPEVAEGFLQSGLYFGSLLGGLGVFIVGQVYGSKKVSPMARPGGIGVTVGLTPEEVKHVRRQVLGKEPIDVNHLSVLRGAAVQLREGLAKQLLWSPGLLVYFAGQSLSRGVHSVIDVIMIVLLLGMAVVLGISARQFLQTGAFLTSTYSSGSDNLK
ncbi:hypothetical protein [Arthrobacter sp. CG_A4]|uniref:hypothetical protein n=1 Tax=Arthrobacter sp. CG_A4 TaxID=3071706 RepID=UPI002E05D3F6|nr:hypothetical protein [Arthrobacter sp. CG_A4]